MVVEAVDVDDVETIRLQSRQAGLDCGKRAVIAIVPNVGGSPPRLSGRDRTLAEGTVAADLRSKPIFVARAADERTAKTFLG
jgi:hypothetical protein